MNKYYYIELMNIIEVKIMNVLDNVITHLGRKFNGIPLEKPLTRVRETADVNPM